MASTLGPAQTHQDTAEIKAVEEALSRLLQEASAIGSDRRTDIARAAQPSIDATLHSAELKDDRFQSVRPSFGRRASRSPAS